MYIAGDTFDAGNYESQAVYWKNGAPVILGEVNSTSTSVAADNSDVYAAVNLYANYPMQPVLFYKNTSLTTVTSEPANVFINGIAALDGNVYLAGSLDRKPAFWKNGKETQLSDTDGLAYSVLVVKH